MRILTFGARPRARCALWRDRRAWRPEVRREMYDPKDETNAQTDEMTCDAIASWATAMLKGMRECPIKDYLDSEKGKYSEGHADAMTREALSGIISRVNDLAESDFGVVDEYFHRFMNQKVSTAAGVATSVLNHDYDIAYTNAAARKEPEARKSPSGAPTEDGAFTALPTEMQDSLVETSRKKLAHDESKEAERTLAQHLYFSELEKAKKDKKLASLRHQFKNACIAFEIERLTTQRALMAALAAAESEPKQLKLLRDQVRHYLHGLGLKQEPFGPALSFSSSADPSVGTIDDLTARVGKMITAAEALDLPDEPPLPALTIRAPSQLGTVTKQRQQLGEAALNEANSKKAKWAEEIRVERATGKSKKRNGARAARQPRRAAMPTIEALVEQRIEILFRCGFDVIAPPAKSKGKGKGKKMPPKVKRVSELLWCAGEVIEVSDATTVVKGRTLGAGHVYVRYDPPADEPDAEIEEDWFQIRTSLYGKGEAGSWRLAKALTDGVGADDLADLSGVEESDESDDDDARASPRAVSGDSDSESESESESDEEGEGGCADAT